MSYVLVLDLESGWEPLRFLARDHETWVRDVADAAIFPEHAAQRARLGLVEPDMVDVIPVQDAARLQAETMALLAAAISPPDPLGYHFYDI